MRTVLAFEPDPKQAAALKLVVSDRVGANFVLAESKDAALAAIRANVPDLILLTALISPRDETEIADLIRELDGAEHTQTLTIPLLELSPSRPVKKKKRGLLSALTGEPDEPTAPSGCDPKVFADEVANYLQQAEHAKVEAALSRERLARKPRRKKKDVAEVPPDSVPSTGASSYWAWDAPLEAPAPGAPPPAAPESTVAVAAQSSPDLSVEPTVDTATAAESSSSWDNPWDVTAPSIWKAPTALQNTYVDDHIIPGPDPFVASPTETVDALLEQPVHETAADQLAAATVHGVAFIRPEPEPVADAPSDSEVLTAPDAYGQALVPPPAAEEPPGEPERRVHLDSEIVRAKLPTRAESGALLALQADVARLRQQRESTDATLIAAKAAQLRAAREASEAAALAKQHADRRAEEAASRAREEARAERKAREHRERQAREQAERRVEAERKAREEAERRAAAERKAREQAERRAREETARLEREARERQAHAEAERKAREAAEAHAAAERKAREQAERRAREDAERLAREAERKAREEADRLAKKAAQAAREQVAQLAREAEARAREEAAAERRARQQAEQRAEAEREARQELERRTEAERKAREAAEKAAEAARAEAAPARKTVPARKKNKSKKADAQPKRAKKDTGPRAIQDEWGLYDPHAAGFEALFAKLESIENGEIDAEEPAPPRRTPRPLAMWAFQFEPAAEPPAVVSPKGRDDFRALVSQFSIPHAVAAVSYATGARIHRVKVSPPTRTRAGSEPDPGVVILSRKLLKAARKVRQVA